MIKTLFRQIKKNLKIAYLNSTQLYFSVFKAKVECNICHFKMNQLKSDSWHLYTNCPRCGSRVRQRLLWTSLSLLKDFHVDKIIKNKRVLHFAPEPDLSELIREKSAFYKTSDILTEGYSYEHLDFNMSIEDMKQLTDESFDCVIACDVLEHVPDHIGGIKEVYRVLTKGGYCIFTVPQKDNLKVTFEDDSIIDPTEREKVFGQFDHLRIYGEDFSKMLSDSGFKVTAVDESYFDKNVVDRHVLFPPILSKHPLATNYRKVFFGLKS
jgi:SAM-dependent methyltransferase